MSERPPDYCVTTDPVTISLPASVTTDPVTISPLASGSTAVIRLAALPARNGARRAYRHRGGQCSRLLFVGHLPPGTYIEIRCPACGRLHVIYVTEAGLVDSEQPFDVE